MIHNGNALDGVVTVGDKQKVARRPSGVLNGAGFTLVELLIVIVVIGILAGLSTLAYAGYQRRSIDVATRAVATSAFDAVKTYQANSPTSIYPSDLATAGYVAPSDVTVRYMTSSNASRFCVQVNSQRQTDIVYYASTDLPRPQAGTCPSSGY